MTQEGMGEFRKKGGRLQSYISQGFPENMTYKATDALLKQVMTRTPEKELKAKSISHSFVIQNCFRIKLIQLREWGKGTPETVMIQMLTTEQVFGVEEGCS